MDPQPAPQSSAELRTKTLQLHPVFKLPISLQTCPIKAHSPTTSCHHTAGHQHLFTDPSHQKTRLGTYTGWGRGAQVGSPSAPKALESQRHQSSMTSPLPEHHNKLMVASCRSWERGEGVEHWAGELPSHHHLCQCSSIL